MKTSDFFEVNLRTFGSKPPYFYPKKSDVFNFRNWVVQFQFLRSVKVRFAGLERWNAGDSAEEVCL